MNQREMKKRAREIIEAADAFVLSTVSGKRPQSRVMGTKLVDKGLTIYMETYADSRKVKHLKKNSSAQLLFMSKDKSEVVTLSGKATLDDSVSLKKRIWAKNPASAKYFSGYEDPRLAIIRFTPETLEYVGPQTNTDIIKVKLR
ncbi:MAG: hypothetical protein Kow0099_23490 [Candidatus Abyssubacteria bacterium]